MRTHEREPSRDEAGWNECYAAITRELDFDDRREDPRRDTRERRRAHPATRSVRRVARETSGKES